MEEVLEATVRTEIIIFVRHLKEEDIVLDIVSQLCSSRSANTIFNKALGKCFW
jgi:hypothetical protein